ncbi:MAG: hypothetical protein IT289_13155 [Oligoflexia bacterium]|nr:hypothetical protein [Oligoflexia bacterium]
MNRLAFGLVVFMGLTIMACTPATFMEVKAKQAGLTPSGSPTPGPTISPTPPPALSNFGMVSNQTQCVICHLNVYGNLGSTDSSPFSLHINSMGTIYGNVFANHPIARQTFDTLTGQVINSVADPIHNLLERILPGPTRVTRVGVANSFTISDNLLNTDQTGISFPTFKAAKISAGAQGTIKQNGSTIVDKIRNGNLILDGRSQTIEVSGETYINGDLIIHGNFRGLGTIYVNGTIFIPDDIVVENNATLFSGYRSAVTSADTIAQAAVSNGIAGLRLGASQHIIIGYPGAVPAGFNLMTAAFPPDTRLKNYVAGRDNSNYVYSSYYSYNKVNNVTSQTAVYDGTNWNIQNRTRLEAASNYLNEMSNYGLAPASVRARVFDSAHDPNYLARLKPEYDLPAQVCGTGKNFRVGFGTVARIDATLYAQQSIGGVVTGGGNAVVNGGVITQTLAFLPGTGYELESWGADPGGVGVTRVAKIFELQKNCADIVNGGSGQFFLPYSTVNPINGVESGKSIITYDYRLRNGGAGFDIMRTPGY